MAAPVRTDAFEVAPASPPANAASPAERQGYSRPDTAPIPTPTPSRLSSINQPMSQAVAAPTPVAKPSSDEPLLKDPDAKLTADQIFTF